MEPKPQPIVDRDLPRLMLRALGHELGRFECPAPGNLAAWAREVALYLEEHGPGPIEADKVLPAVDAAVSGMLGSDRWHLLLRDALMRPKAFARALILMAYGRVYHPAAGRKASHGVN